MVMREQDDLSYRSAVPEPTVAKSIVVNESEYSSLKTVRKLLAQAVDDLSKNFNAFDILKKEDTTVAAVDLLRQVEVNQAVYNILVPLLDTVDSAITSVKRN